MASHGGTTTSYWAEEIELARPPLTADASCDVCVIGAGIAGLSVAYELVAGGAAVIVIDADTPATYRQRRPAVDGPHFGIGS